MRLSLTALCALIVPSAAFASPLIDVFTLAYGARR